MSQSTEHLIESDWRIKEKIFPKDQYELGADAWSNLRVRFFRIRLLEGWSPFYAAEWKLLGTEHLWKKFWPFWFCCLILCMLKLGKYEIIENYYKNKKYQYKNINQDNWLFEIRVRGPSLLDSDNIWLTQKEQNLFNSSVISKILNRVSLLFQSKWKYCIIVLCYCIIILS